MDWERRFVRLIWVLDTVLAVLSPKARDRVQQIVREDVCRGMPALRHHIVDGKCTRCGLPTHVAMKLPTCLPAWVQP